MNLISKKVSIVLLFAIVLISSYSTKAQTNGALTFTVNLTSHNAGYGLKHVTAIWVENSATTFIKTKYRMASGHTLNSHLPIWKAKSNSNVVDATSGATLNSYSPITVIWNATDVNALLVPDGIYKVFVEFTWDDGGNNKDSVSIAWLKSPTPVHLTPANQTNFTGMDLNWVPSGAGLISYKSSRGISIYPNPCFGLLYINFGEESNGCNILIFNQSGMLVFEEAVSKGTLGDFGIDMGSFSNGLYTIKIQGDSQDASLVTKIILSK